MANEWKDKGWRLISGGGQPEVRMPGPGGGVKGSAYADIELFNPATGQTMRINTVDTLADGITPTAREVENALKIHDLSKPGDSVMMIAKPKASQIGVGLTVGGVAGSAHANNDGIFGTSVTWSDVGNFALDLLIPGGLGDAGAGSDFVPRGGPAYISPTGSTGGGAAGGYLIYPNKSNANMTRSVYSK